MVYPALAAALVFGATVLLPSTSRLAPDCGDAAFSSAVPLSRAATDSTNNGLYAVGQAFPEFLEATQRRREGWHRINDGVVLEDSAVARARAVGGNWRILVIAVDACGDSMQQVPYVARLAERVEGLSMRIVTPAVGSAAQRSHRSLDGRTATPTYVLLDEAGADRGCVVELPREVREWTHARRDSMKSDALHAYRNEWYTRDKGASIVREMVELMEAAKSGTSICERGSGPAGGDN
jgi:hypothetical protein